MTRTLARALRVGARYCGPPDTANGGYVSGLLAAELAQASPAVSVRLLAPVPLERELEILRAGDGLELRDPGDAPGEKPLAVARPTGFLDDPPAAPSFVGIGSGSRRCRAFETHPFPRCFVCGPERPTPDGLAIWPERLAEGWVGAEWTVAASLVDDAGAVRPEFIWAALDCASSFALLEPTEAQAFEPMVLGTLVARVSGCLRAGEIARVGAWSEGFSGRRGVGGTAVWGGDGRLIGVARATWVSLAGRSGSSAS